MKQLFFCSLLLAGCSAGFAQTQKGQSITSGNIGLSYNGAKSTALLGSDVYGNKVRGYAIEIGLNRGVFFKDNWSFNYNLGLRYNQGRADDGVGSVAATYKAVYTGYAASVGLGVRRYWSVADRLFVYAGGGLTANRQWDVNETQTLSSTPTPVFRYRTVNWSVQPTGQVGLLYTLTNRLALEANAQTNGFPISVGGVGLGLAILTGASSQGQGSYPATDSVGALQTRKGRWLLGASAQVFGQNRSEQRNQQPEQQVNTANAIASLLIGRFVRDNVLVGAGVDYTAGRSGDQALPGPVNYSLAFNAYVRSYLGTNRLRPFVQGQINYGGFGSQTSDDSGRTHQVGVQASAGLAYLLGDRFIIQTTLGLVGGYYRWIAALPDNRTSTSFAISANATTFSNFAVYYAL